MNVYGKSTKNVNIPYKEPLKEELGSFLHAVKNNEDPKITGEDGIYALKVVTAAMKSAKDISPVDINDY